MEKFFKKYKIFIRYILISVIATIFNICIYIFYMKILKDKYVISNVFSWIISTFINYILNKKIVFNNKSNKNFKEIVLFYLLRLGSLLIDTVVLCLCIEKLDINENIAKIISNSSTAIINYSISKVFIFKNDKKGE